MYRVSRMTAPGSAQYCSTRARNIDVVSSAWQVEPSKALKAFSVYGRIYLLIKKNFVPLVSQPLRAAQDQYG